MSRATDIARQALVNRVAIRMRLRRQRSGATQADLARRLGVHPSQLMRWEAGIHAIPIYMLAGYALALGCEVSDLLMAADYKLVGRKERAA